MTDEMRLKRLKYRAHHRGFKEADLLIGAFVDTHAHEFSDDQLTRLESLLEEQDQDIYDWFLGKSPVPPEHDTDVFALLKSFDFFPRAHWK